MRAGSSLFNRTQDPALIYFCPAAIFLVAPGWEQLTRGGRVQAHVAGAQIVSLLAMSVRVCSTLLRILPHLPSPHRYHPGCHAKEQLTCGANGRCAQSICLRLRLEFIQRCQRCQGFRPSFALPWFSLIGVHRRWALVAWSMFFDQKMNTPTLLYWLDDLNMAVWSLFSCGGCRLAFQLGLFPSQSIDSEC